MVYYQQPAAYYTAPQRMMYVQYVQPARPFARSTQAAEALVAGETVATGTYLKGKSTKILTHLQQSILPFTCRLTSVV